MLKVKVLFKSGGVVEFDAASLVYNTSTSEENYGELVGYDIKTIGTHTSHVFLDIKGIDAIVCVADSIIEETKQGG